MHLTNFTPARTSWRSLTASALLSPDAPQSWPSYLCHGLISFLGFLLLLITFPISGWFALKVRLAGSDFRGIGPHSPSSVPFP